MNGGLGRRDRRGSGGRGGPCDRNGPGDQLRAAAGRDRRRMRGGPGRDEVPGRRSLRSRPWTMRDDESSGRGVGRPRHRQPEGDPNGLRDRFGPLGEGQSRRRCRRGHGDRRRRLRRGPRGQVDRCRRPGCGQAHTACERRLARYEQDRRECGNPLPWRRREQARRRFERRGLERRQDDRRQRRRVQTAERCGVARALDGVEGLVRGRDHDLEAAVELPPTHRAFQHGGPGIPGPSDGLDRPGTGV